MANREEVEAVTDFFSWVLNSLQMVTAAMKLKKMLALWKESCDKPRLHIKNQTSLCDKGLYSQSYGFSSSHVQLWELDHKEGWELKNWCFQSVVLEKTHESPLDHEKIKPVNTKEIKLEYSLKRMMLKLQYFGHVMWRVNSLEKTLILGKTEGKRIRGHRGWHG